ncbi:MAG: tetratricopeptide repeat protein, partial [Bdellovibrionota bacterium]
VHVGDPSDSFRLSRVFASRQGSPIVVAMLYGFLAERIGVSLEFVDFRPACFLKWVDSGHCRYIDVGRGGSTLASDEVIDLLHSYYQLTTVGLDQLLEVVTFERLLTTYLSQLKQAFAPRKEYEKTLYLQNALIAYQPSNLQLIAERAVLHRKLGHFKSALADLKRFFAFNDRDRAPADLVKLHDDLVTLLDRHRAGLETDPN